MLTIAHEHKNLHFDNKQDIHMTSRESRGDWLHHWFDLLVQILKQVEYIVKRVSIWDPSTLWSCPTPLNYENPNPQVAHLFLMHYIWFTTQVHIWSRIYDQGEAPPINANTRGSLSHSLSLYFAFTLALMNLLGINISAQRILP